MRPRVGPWSISRIWPGCSTCDGQVDGQGGGGAAGRRIFVRGVEGEEASADLTGLPRGGSTKAKARMLLGAERPLRYDHVAVAGFDLLDVVGRLDRHHELKGRRRWRPGVQGQLAGAGSGEPGAEALHRQARPAAARRAADR